MYEVKRFSKMAKSKLFSQKDREEVKKEAKKLVSLVNKNYNKTMEILGK